MIFEHEEWKHLESVLWEGTNQESRETVVSPCDFHERYWYCNNIFSLHQVGCECVPSSELTLPPPRTRPNTMPITVSPSLKSTSFKLTLCFILYVCTSEVWVNQHYLFSGWISCGRFFRPRRSLYSRLTSRDLLLCLSFSAPSLAKSSHNLAP